MIPNLKNPIFVEIKQVDTTSTVYRDRRREPSLSVSYQPSFRIPAQIYFGDKAVIHESGGSPPTSRELGGVIEDATGYIIVRKSDLKEIGKTLNLDDRLVSYGQPGAETICKYYLVGTKDAAHYSDVGNCTLERWYFQDRE